MKNRKISTAIAEKVMTGVLTILMAISVTACGSTKEQTNPDATEVIEAVVTTETESEFATEAKAENEIASEMEAVAETETETETEEPVLFRIRLKKMGDTEGAWVTNRPGEEFEDMFIVKAGTCFDVYEEAEETNGLFYKIKLEDGSIGWVYSNDVEIID